MSCWNWPATWHLAWWVPKWPDITNQEEWCSPGLHLLDSAQINQSANWVPQIFPQAQQETIFMRQWNNKFKTKFAFIIPLRGVYLQQYWCMSIIILLQLLDDSHKLHNSHREEFIWSVGARCVVVIPDIKENVSSSASQKKHHLIVFPWE
jgi:hypothetical protein